MDLQTANDDNLAVPETDLPINIVKLIVSNDTDKNLISEIDLKDPESHDNKVKETQKDLEEGSLKVQEEEKKEPTNNNIKDGIEDNEQQYENEEVDQVVVGKTENDANKIAVNGIFTGDLEGKNLELLWAEAIKAQNDGRYKDAIRNFTAIYEVS